MVLLRSAVDGDAAYAVHRQCLQVLDLWHHNHDPGSAREERSHLFGAQLRAGDSDRADRERIFDRYYRSSKHATALRERGSGFPWPSEWR